MLTGTVGYNLSLPVEKSEGYCIIVVDFIRGPVRGVYTFSGSLTIIIGTIFGVTAVSSRTYGKR